MKPLLKSMEGGGMSEKAIVVEDLSKGISRYFSYIIEMLMGTS